MRGASVYRQYVGYAREHGVTVHAVANKITEPADLEFLRTALGVEPLVAFGMSPFVRAAERADVRPIELLESATRDGLDALTAAADAAPRDPARYSRQAAEFHARNATAWANDRAGTDLTTQIDPDFVMPTLEESCP